jgi:hypothetical protein
MTKKRYLGSNHCLRREYAKCIYMARAKGITSVHITIVYIAILVNVVFCPGVAVLIVYNLGFTLARVVLYSI